MHATERTEGNPMDRTSMKLEGDRTIIISRAFDGPARIVFEAWTRPELVKRWWAPKSRGVSLPVCEADVRVGGKYRYVLRLPSGDEMGFSGEYTEITPHTRLVYTQIFEPMAEAGAVICTIQLDERGGKTFLVSHELYPSAEARQAAIDAGMEGGMRETMDQLDELVASLA